jgi:hypothetical protein
MPRVLIPGTDILSPWNRVLEKLTAVYLVKTFLPNSWNLKVHYRFTEASHRSLS